MFLVSGITEVRPVIGEVLPDSLASRAGLRGGDTIVALDGHPVAGQRDVVLGLLDGMSGSGRVSLAVADAQGARRTVQLQVADAQARRRLTEPDLLFRGLGFGFWQPPQPAILGSVEAGRPGCRRGAQGRG